MSLALLAADSALANGIRLATREGQPGEHIPVLGGDWFVGNPRVMPAEHVELFLVGDGRRLRLFDVPADFGGEIATTFQVPRVEPGSYRLQSCGHEPPGRAGRCRAEGEFTVLPGMASPSDARGVLLVVAALVLLASLLGLLAVLARKRKPGGTP